MRSRWHPSLPVLPQCARRTIIGRHPPRRHPNHPSHSVGIGGRTGVKSGAIDTCMSCTWHSLVRDVGTTSAARWAMPRGTSNVWRSSSTSISCPVRMVWCPNVPLLLSLPVSVLLERLFGVFGALLGLVLRFWFWFCCARLSVHVFCVFSLRAFCASPCPRSCRSLTRTFFYVWLLPHTTPATCIPNTRTDVL